MCLAVITVQCSLSAVGVGGVFKSLWRIPLVDQITSHLRSKESRFLIGHPKDVGVGRYFLIEHSSVCQGIHKKLLEEDKRAEVGSVRGSTRHGG